MASAGEAAKGFKTLNWHATGTNFPALQDIQKRVVDAGKSLAPKDEVGQVLYNRGVYNSVLIAEDGNLRDEYSTDGLHLTAAGNKAWASALRKQLEP